MSDHPAIPVTEQPIPPVADTTDEVVFGGGVFRRARVGETLPTPPPVPPLTPIGTVETGFWQRSGTLLAIVGTVAFVNGFFIRPWVTSRFGQSAAVAFDGLEWAWLAAFGIQKAGPPSLRYS